MSNAEPQQNDKTYNIQPKTTSIAHMKTKLKKAFSLHILPVFIPTHRPTDKNAAAQHKA